MEAPEPVGPRFVALCGIPFSGKSRLATRLAIEMGGSLVSIDLIVTSLGIDLGADASNQRGWARAMAIGFDWSRRQLASGSSVVFDNANHTRRNRDRCRRVAEHAGARFRLVWVDTPVEEARRRLLENRREPVRGDVPDASFCEIVDQFEAPIVGPGTVRVTPEMTMGEVLLAIA